MADDQPLPIYLDHNATTPPSDAAWEAMLECRDEGVWGNPSSSHAYGLHAKYFLDEARSSVASSVGASDPTQIIFTSGGTEANNLAITGTVLPLCRVEGSARRNVIVTTVFEHDAVTTVVNELVAHHGCRVELLPIDESCGEINLKAAEAVLRKCLRDVALVTVMHANNEIGSIQPIAQIASLLSSLSTEFDIPRPALHCDASQSLGKIAVDVNVLGVDLLTVCSHKFYGPKGVGALYRRSKQRTLALQTFGAGQESGQRPGTENLILIRGMAAALKDATEHLEQYSREFREARDRLFSALQESARQHSMELHVNSAFEHCLPNTLSVAIFHTPSQLYASASRLIDALGTRIAFSAGAACHEVNGEEIVKISPTLRSIGVGPDRAKGTLRLSTGHLARLGDMERAAKLIIRTAISQMPA